MEQKFNTKKFVVACALALLAIYGSKMLGRTFDVETITQSNEAQASTVAVKPLGLSELKGKLKGASKPSIVFLYASWCGYCVQQHQIMQDFLNGESGDVNLYAISVDRDEEKLKAFLSNKPQPLYFTPYHLPPIDYKGYQLFFSRYGGSFSGGIPYMGIFNTKGEMVLELPGLSSQATLEEAVAAAAAN